MIRTNVNYEMDNEMYNEIVTVKNIIIRNFDDVEVYLYGSVAKGCYSSESDIDLLILYKGNEELHRLRMEINRLIPLNGREIQCVFYKKDSFIESLKEVSFASSILQDLVDVKEW